MSELQPRVTIFDIVKAFIKKHQTTILFGFDIILNLVIIASMVFLIRTFLISPFQVYGPSMCDTMNNIDNVCQHGYGEYIIVNKFGYQSFPGWQVGLPQRGDIVVFHPPVNKEEFFIKRVIGLPGETVKLKDGYVYVFNKEHPEGFQLDEPYLNSTNSGNTHPYSDGPSVFEIPSDGYLVLGDNRTASSDARSCFKESISSGGCKQESNSPYLRLGNFEGKAWLVLWPLSKIAVLNDPVYNN